MPLHPWNPQQDRYDVGHRHKARPLTLYDPTGLPIPADDIARLREEAAGPVLGGVRSVVSATTSTGMTPWRLAQILKAADMGETLAWQELAEEIEEREPQYLTVLSTRKNAVTELPLTVVAAEGDAAYETHAEFVRDWLDTGLLDDVLFDVLDAIGKGWSVTEIVWDVSPDGIVPKALIPRLQRWFEIDRTDGNTVLMRDAAGFVPLQPFKFLVHRHRAKTGLLLRSGLTRAVAWAWMLKSFTERDWGIFVQNYGQPVRLGRYAPGASQGDRRVLWRAVSNIAGDCAAIIPNTMEVEFIQPPQVSGSAEVHHKRVVYFDQVISKLVLGQTTTTDAVSGGHAVSKEHRLVAADIERADAKALATTITRQLVQLIVSLNFGPQPKYPRVHIGQTDAVPLEQVSRILQFAGPQGLTIKADELREQLGGYSKPEPGDEVVGGRPPPVSPGGPQGPTPTVTSPGLPTTSEDPPASYAQPGTDVMPGAAPGAAPDTARQSRLRALLARHTRTADPETIALLTDRVAEDAQGALRGLTDQVRDVIEDATDMHDLAHRLSGLELDREQFTVAMQRAIALAHLVGQASLLDEIGRGAG